MRVLVLGGAGRVARWTLPHLRAHHDLTTFDRVPPADVLGDALSPRDVTAAVRHHDAILHLCSVVPRGAGTEDPRTLGAAWAANVGSVHVALEAARKTGVRRFVLASSMSVVAAYGRERVEPDARADATEPYGFTKRLAEDACAHYAEAFGLHATALRLSFPTPDAAAPAWLEPATGRLRHVRLGDGTPVPATPARVVADRVREALAFDGTFRAVPVVADGVPWA